MIYLDNAASTPVKKEVFEAMTPYFLSEFGNSQSSHAAGRAAAEALLSARDEVASVFGCESGEVYFLSGGTEAGNLAVKGACINHFKKMGVTAGNFPPRAVNAQAVNAGDKGGRGHIIVSAVEHPCVYESALEMREAGVDVTFIEPSSDGVVPPEEVLRAIRPDTFFCAVMAVNNETGVLQKYGEIGEICRNRGIFYYCDFVQGVHLGKFPVGECSAFAVSAHKFGGPKGVAAMYIKKGERLAPLVCGGTQERGLRGGTVNVAGSVGLAKSLSLAVSDRAGYARVRTLCEEFLNGALKIGGARLNGARNVLSGGIVNLSFEGCAGANVLFNLDLNGVCASTGSACSAGATVPSRVIRGMAGEERARSAVRFSFGVQNTEQDVEYALGVLEAAVKKARG